MDIAVHINTTLSHQVEHGERLRLGFIRHGITPTVTSDPSRPADIHVISGPWYAEKFWRKHPRVIKIDRCHYRGNPNHVSIGWMRSDGSRDFYIGVGRKPPTPAPMKTGNKTVFLADYHGPAHMPGVDGIRLHPNRAKPREPLDAMLARFDCAVGGVTTALTLAALAGLRVHCTDTRGLMSRPDWLEVLPYVDWSLDEIENGDAWDHLKYD